MESLEEIRTFFGRDAFASGFGMEVESVGEGFARCRMTLTDAHRNAAGSIQGGVIFTLADFAFAVAANHESIGVVTLSSSIQFVATPGDTVLVAEAKLLRETRAVSFYEVRVVDGTGAHIAQVSVTGYRSAPRR